MSTKTARPPSRGHDQATNVKRSRPCDACRRRKSKCVTEQDSHICVLCKFHAQECTYLEAPLPRKRTAPPSSTADAHPVKRSRTIHSKPGTGVEEYDALPGPSLLKRTLGLQNRHHSEYVGPNAIPDVYGRHHTTDGDGEPTAGTYVRFVHPSAAFRVIPDRETTDHDKERLDLDEIEETARGYGPQLVELFFRIVHPALPILHKDVFLEKYARSYREFSPPLLAAVYLLASVYWGYSESLAQTQRIDTSALQASAFSALQNTMRRPKLSTIQAGLLLSQYQKAFMGAVPNEQRDRLTVQLVNLAHGLGLHLDCSEWDIPDWEIGLRRRIGWALYMQDSWSALLESRPALIGRDDWDVRDLSDDDFPEQAEDEQEGSSEVGRGRLVFMEMASLTVILSEILTAVFSARARREISCAKDRLATLLSLMKPLQLRLKDWFSTLPDALRMDTVASMKLSSVGYLRLAYLTVEVCIHRNLLRTLMTTDRPDPMVAQVCRNAANERFINATDFIHRLQAQHLASFWYFISAKCCALIYSLGQILAWTTPSEEEAELYSKKLKEYKFALKVNSEAGAAFMRQALDLINFTVRIAPLEHASMTTSPASGGFSLPEQSPVEEKQVQWTSQAYEDANNYHEYDIGPVDFPTSEALFATYPDGIDSQWYASLD